MGISSQEWSKIGDGNQNRCTTVYEDGSSRNADERADGGITVTDTGSDGRSVSGDGARGLCGLSDAGRLNNNPSK